MLSFRSSHAKPTIDIWPLHLLDTEDAEQMDILYKMFRFSLPVITYYLSVIVFPAVLNHQSLKISACGQEVYVKYSFQFHYLSLSD
jgi:hypothetical protein